MYFVSWQPVVPAGADLRCGIGDVFPGIPPAYFVFLAPHKFQEIVLAARESFVVVDDICQAKFLAFALGGRMILGIRHSFCFCFLLL